MSDSYDEGMRVRREVLGDEHVERSIARTTDLTRDFQAHITRRAWGDVWARPGLERRERSLMTIALMTALRAEDELALHIRAAVRSTGLTREEIGEAIMHAGVYAGVPQANTAFAVAQRVFAELDAEPSPG